MSHLLQMRGLKRIDEFIEDKLEYVASFTDAWIETPRHVPIKSKPGSRIFYRCVD